MHAPTRKDKCDLFRDSYTAYIHTSFLLLFLFLWFFGVFFWFLCFCFVVFFSYDFHFDGYWYSLQASLTLITNNNEKCSTHKSAGLGPSIMGRACVRRVNVSKLHPVFAGDYKSNIRGMGERQENDDNNCEIVRPLGRTVVGDRTGSASSMWCSRNWEKMSRME